ncbi:hypothetical protein [Pedobacter sp. UBA5917]|jgi:hypothetical protein|uniref:hypothetical protein n=1 Tax=Pedobacter sp. UBA5917 TaxID=1947061 RepID=UPI0025DD1B52|nr:hypothetical protein [Pedobacter sp. UBA5917]
MKNIMIIALLVNAALITVSFTLKTDIPFLLGTNACKVKYKQNNGIATLISLHDNENTAIDAFNSLPKEINFNLFEIHQQNLRTLTCRVDNKNYLFDPNRIFSQIGIKATLEKYND